MMDPMEIGPATDGAEVTPRNPGEGGTTGRVVTVFRSRLRPGAEAEYEPVAAEMEALARAMPGFDDFTSFAAGDGERVSIVVFDSPETHAAWRDHPDHRRAQQLGRSRLYETYSIQVCLEAHHHRHGRET
jgi:heme-degrading monooxygenase HmoA